MDSTTLVEKDIEEGKKLIEELDASGFPVPTAFWYYTSETEEWRLFLATPFLDKYGLKDTYKRINKILRKMHTPSNVDLTNIYVISPEEVLIKSINTYIKTGKFAEKRLFKTTADRVYIENALLYRSDYDTELESALSINAK